MLNRFVMRCADRRSQPCIRRQGGFSLIEVAIALIVLGLIMTPIIVLYNTQLKSSQLENTAGAASTSILAINQFFMSQGHYPCPASLITREGDADFGIEGDCSNLASMTLCSDASWRTTTGICKTDDSADAVILGGIPFDALGMNPEETFDSWASKFTYGVTYAQTSAATFSGHTGALRIHSYYDHDNDASTPPIVGDVTGSLAPAADLPDFIVFSSGETGAGAYNAEGTLIAACPAAAAGYESENCDLDNEFFLDVNPVDPRQGSRSDVAGVTFYDDITRIQINVPQAIWFPHPVNAAHLITMSTRVGVGTNTPTETLDVMGDGANGEDGFIQANGSVKSDDLCNPDGTDCFDPRFVTEVTTCDGGSQSGVIVMAYNELDCAAAVDESGNPIDGEGFVFPNPYQWTSCPAGTLQQGFDGSGDPICVIP